jgi:hypothetical protein
VTGFTDRITTGHVHAFATCYGQEQHPCPSCGTPVRQSRIICGTPDTALLAECRMCELRCRECPSEVRITEGSSGYRARVIHSAACPFLARHRAGRDPGAVPCGTSRHPPRTVQARPGPEGVMTGPSPLADACPFCHPGDHPAVLPFLVIFAGTSLRALYRHQVCGTIWPCSWDADATGWPRAEAA